MGFFNDPTAYVVGYDDGRGVKIPAKDFVSNSSGGVMWVNVSMDDLTSDKTYNEIIEALNAGLMVAVKFAHPNGSWSTGYLDFVGEYDVGFRTLPELYTEENESGLYAISLAYCRIFADNHVTVNYDRIIFENSAIAKEQ